MAGSKISVLTAGAALGGTEALPAVQSAATVKITAAQIKAYALGAASALSAPGLPVTGAWVTGGSTTTTKPHALIEPTGTTSTAWSTSGTGLGINAASGFTGNLFDLQVAGVQKLRVDQNGAVASQSALTGTSVGANSNIGSLSLGAGFDVLLTRGGAAATLQHGAADAASPVAQTIKFQDVVAGTSNTAGVNATIQAPAGTGTGAGGSLIFQVAPAGSSGSAKNAWATAFSVNGSGVWATSTTGNATVSGTFSAGSINFGGGARSSFSSATDGVFTFANNAATNSFTITAGASNLATFNGGITLGGPLKVSNAYVATPQVPTGYITIYDSTGTAYKVSVNV